MILIFSRASCLLAVLALLAPFDLLGQGTDEELARRIAAVASIALDEYALGVVDGQVVAAAELEEARLFVGEARRWAISLSPDARATAIPPLDALVGGVERLVPAADLQDELLVLRGALEQAVGVALDPMPSSAPALARGRAVYEAQCALCHGELGAGDGFAGAGLNPPPADLTDSEALRSSSPLDFFRKTTVGVAGTGMPGFEQQQSLEDRWAVALYASTLRFPRDEGDPEGEALADCPDCLLLVSDFFATAALSDDSLAGLLETASGFRGSPPQAALGYARTAGAADVLGSDRRFEGARTIKSTKEGVAAAVELAAVGERERAIDQALEAYLVFERVELDVRARDAAAAARVEAGFADLRSALAGGDEGPIHEASTEVSAALDGAFSPGGAVASLPALFGQSLVIMLREGLEAILIIGALVAFLQKAGARDRIRDIGWGVGAAVGASLITAVGFATLWQVSTAQREALEGFTMVLAAAVLFWVSYWLVSKIEIKKWQAFVGQQMGKALSSRSALALSAVAFLAVYREGFETVLFYAALFASASGIARAPWSITSGILLGGTILGVVYFVIQRFGVRIPLKRFFAVTSTLLYLMAFSFAGQGIAELQEGGYVPTTQLDWVPSVPFFGIFPTTQTLAIQLFLAVALLGALAWVFWLEPVAAARRR